MGTSLLDFYERSGPFLSVHLATGPDRDRRWQRLRARLSHNNADLADRLDATIRTHVPEGGLAALADGSGDIIVRGLWLDVPDRISTGPVPDAAHLLAQQQALSTHLIVVTEPHAVRILTVHENGRSTLVRAVDGPLNGFAPALAGSIMRTAARIGAGLVAIAGEPEDVRRLAASLDGASGLDVFPLEDIDSPHAAAVEVARVRAAERATQVAEELRNVDDEVVTNVDDALDMVSSGEGQWVVVDARSRRPMAVPAGGSVATVHPSDTGDLEHLIQSSGDDRQAVAQKERTLPGPRAVHHDDVQDDDVAVIDVLLQAAIENKIPFAAVAADPLHGVLSDSGVAVVRAR